MIDPASSFGRRVRDALIPFLEGYLGADARELVEAEIEESGEPNSLVAALGLGHALLVRIEDETRRAEAHEALDALLRDLKATSIVPPPVSG